MEDNVPLVSCITPTFNRFNLLRETYWCWNNQTYPNKELIIVNDEKNFVITCKDPRVKIINLDTRFNSLGSKRNFCVEQTSPKAMFIAPIDDDDLFYPDHLSTLIEGFSKNPNAHRVKNARHYGAKDNKLFTVYGLQSPFFGASCFTAEFLRNNKFDEKLTMGEDTKLMNSTDMITQIVDTKRPKFIYRQGMGVVHASGNSGLLAENKQQQLFDMIGKAARNHRQKITVELDAHICASSKKLYDECLITGMV